MQRIAIDMDEVIADTLEQYLARLNRDFGCNWKKKDLHGKRPFDLCTPQQRQHVASYFLDARFFRAIPVMEGSQDVVRELSRRYEIFITTAAMEVPCSFSAKYEWLQEHFPFIPSTHIVFCGDKSIVCADYLIDDNVRHFRQFRGEGILFTAPHNVHETKYRRANSWDDVRRMFC